MVSFTGRKCGFRMPWCMLAIGAPAMIREILYTERGN